MELSSSKHEGDQDPTSRPTGQPDADQVVLTVDDAIDNIGFGPFQLVMTLFCGLLMIADAMEIMFLPIITPKVRCQWNLSLVEEATISSVTLFGAFLGGPFWSVLFDKIGAKKGLFIVDLVILIFDILSALQISPGDAKLPGYPWLLITRFGVGFGAGSVLQFITYYIELLPLKDRGVGVFVMWTWWAVGIICGAVLAVLVIGVGGLEWHWYVGLSSFPSLLALFMFPLVPESARFLLKKGKDNEVQKVILHMARYNGKEAPQGRIVSAEEKEMLVSACNQEVETNIDHRRTGKAHKIKKSVTFSDSDTYEKKLLLVPKAESKWNNLPLFINFRSLIANDTWRTTIILVILWMGTSWLYFGIVLLVPTIGQYRFYCDIFNESNHSLTTECNGDTSHYLKMLWTAAAEFPGLAITLVLINTMGRRSAMALEFVASMIGFLLLLICSSNIINTLFLFLIRTFVSSSLKAVMIYTPEIYPTNARLFGTNICLLAARIGAMMTSYLAQVIVTINVSVTIGVYAGSCFVLAVLAAMLPEENRNSNIALE